MSDSSKNNGSSINSDSNTNLSDPMKGIVKWFNDAKGFGFIEHDKGDVFVHFSSIETAGFKTLKNGEEVMYCLEQGDKGLHAKHVQRINLPIADQEAAANNRPRMKSPLASSIEVERTSQPASIVEDNSHPLSSSENTLGNPQGASGSEPLTSKKL